MIPLIVIFGCLVAMPVEIRRDNTLAVVALLVIMFLAFGVLWMG